MAGAPIWTPEMVAIYFEDAVRTLAALPGGGRSTALARCRLEVVYDPAENYGWSDAPVRPPMPSARKISEMEEVLRWLGHIPHEKFVLRRVVALRAVTHFATGKPMPWKHVGLKVGAHYLAVQTWHGQAIALVVRALIAQATTPWRHET